MKKKIILLINNKQRHLCVASFMLEFVKIFLFRKDLNG